jgi:hypothetical protein
MVFYRLIGTLLLALAVPVLFSACGGSSSSDTAATTVASSAEFAAKGAGGKYAKFGTEGDDAEREAASQVLEENLKAREAGDWQAQCSTMTAKVIKQAESESVHLGAKGGCAEALEVAAEPLASSKAIRADTMTGPIDVLRVKEARAYALYHGTKGHDYAIPMEKEDGGWKVGSVVTSEIK